MLGLRNNQALQDCQQARAHSVNMAWKILAIEKARRGAARFPSLTELAGALILGTTDEVIDMYSNDEATRSEVVRRINAVNNYEHPTHP